MKDGEDPNLTGCYFIEYSERETANDSAPQISIDDGKQMRMRNDSQQRILDTLHKLQI